MNNMSFTRKAKSSNSYIETNDTTNLIHVPMVQQQSTNCIPSSSILINGNDPSLSPSSKLVQSNPIMNHLLSKPIGPSPKGATSTITYHKLTSQPMIIGHPQPQHDQQFQPNQPNSKNNNSIQPPIINITSSFIPITRTVKNDCGSTSLLMTSTTNSNTINLNSVGLNTSGLVQPQHIKVAKTNSKNSSSNSYKKQCIARTQSTQNVSITGTNIQASSPLLLSKLLAPTQSMSISPYPTSNQPSSLLSQPSKAIQNMNAIQTTSMPSRTPIIFHSTSNTPGGLSLRVTPISKATATNTSNVIQTTSLPNLNAIHQQLPTYRLPAPNNHAITLNTGNPILIGTPIRVLQVSGTANGLGQQARWLTPNSSAANQQTITSIMIPATSMNNTQQTIVSQLNQQQQPQQQLPKQPVLAKKSSPMDIQEKGIPNCKIVSLSEQIPIQPKPIFTTTAPTSSMTHLKPITIKKPNQTNFVELNSESQTIVSQAQQCSRDRLVTTQSSSQSCQQPSQPSQPSQPPQPSLTNSILNPELSTLATFHRLSQFTAMAANSAISNPSAQTAIRQLYVSIEKIRDKVSHNSNLDVTPIHPQLHMYASRVFSKIIQIVKSDPMVFQRFAIVFKAALNRSAQNDTSTVSTIGTYKQNSETSNVNSTVKPLITYVSEIRRMMHGFGDSKTPLPETARLIEAIVLDQMHLLMIEANELATYRSVDKISLEEFLYLLRRDRDKLGRLVRSLRHRDLKSALPKLDGSFIYETNTDTRNKNQENKRSLNGKRSRACYSFLMEIDTPIGNYSEFFDDDYQDSITLERNRRLDLFTKQMSKQSYLYYHTCRSVSFAGVNGNLGTQKFEKWIRQSSLKMLNQSIVNIGQSEKEDWNYLITSFGLEALQHFAAETVAIIVELALLSSSKSYNSNNDKQKPLTTWNIMDGLRRFEMNTPIFEQFTKSSIAIEQYNLIKKILVLCKYY